MKVKESQILYLSYFLRIYLFYTNFDGENPLKGRDPTVNTKIK